MTKGPELGPNGKDLGITELRTDITIEGLLQDNHSKIADERRATWYETRAKGELIKVRMCSDARGILPEPDEEIVVNFIAGGPTPPAESILESPGVKSAVIMTHVDGETIIPRQVPKGCKGLSVKEDHVKVGKSNGKIDHYVERHIWHPDPILQACISAEQVAGVTEKPVLAAVQNHRDGTIFPLAVYYRYNQSLVRVTHPKIARTLFGHQYNPEDLYEDGIPTISEDEAFKFSGFMAQDRRRVISLKEEHPNYYEDSKTQNPSAGMLSTDPMPFETRFPVTGSKPGNIYQVFASRRRVESGIIITPDDLRPSLEQMEYLVKTSLENHAQEGKPFANTNTIIIDTEHFAHSFALALRFTRNEESIPKWLELPNHKILLMETTEGVITRIEEFKPR